LHRSPFSRCPVDVPSEGWEVSLRSPQFFGDDQNMRGRAVFRKREGQASRHRDAGESLAATPLFQKEEDAPAV
jgi:hypothetical protein